VAVGFLIFHGLVGVAILGAVTHQLVAVWPFRAANTDNCFSRYRRARAASFTGAVVSLYVVNCCIGAWLYPSYRLDVRIPFEEMGLSKAVGLFELKEHFAGLGLGTLMAYYSAWQKESEGMASRLIATSILGFVVWWDFLAGHILNNIRGL